MEKKFKLEKILEFREKALEREKIKLADLTNKDLELAKEMNIIADDIKEKTIEMEKEKSEGHFDFINMFNKFIEHRRNDFLLVAQKREAINIEIAKQKVVLRNALNDVKVMEKLKAKHLLDYANFVKKQEENQIDEINITRSNKQPN